MSLVCVLPIEKRRDVEEEEKTSPAYVSEDQVPQSHGPDVLKPKINIRQMQFYCLTLLLGRPDNVSANI